MNIPIGLVDEKGKINTVIINETFLAELSIKLRVNGIVPVHTYDDKGKLLTYNTQAVILMAKGCKGNIMFIPND